MDHPTEYYIRNGVSTNERAGPKLTKLVLHIYTCPCKWSPRSHYSQSRPSGMEKHGTETASGLMASFTDFLIVVHHTILYERSIYPSTSFVTTRKYNYPVRQSRHPQVCKWIQDAASAAESELCRGKAKAVTIVILSSLHRPLERFVFDVSKLPRNTVTEDGRHIRRLPPSYSSWENYYTDLEEQYRAILSKLTVCCGQLKPLPAGCSFTLALELQGKAQPPIAHPQPWIPIQPKKSVDDESDKGQPNQTASLPKIVPIRTIEAGDFFLEAWIEDRKAEI